MEIRKGIGVSPGYALGPARVLDREEFAIRRKSVGPGEVDGEIRRFVEARDRAVADLQSRIGEAAGRIGKAAARILEGHAAMLGEDALRRDIEAQLRKHNYSAEYGVSRAFRSRLKMLEESGQDAFVQRIRLDVIEIENALMRALAGRRDEDLSAAGPDAVLVAHSLSPAQIAGLVRGRVAGILLDIGGRSSHVAIVASSLGIPTIVGLESITLDVTSGDTIIVDGSTGTVIVDPDEGTYKRYKAMAHNFAVKERELVEELRDLPAVTRDGTRISIHANIESPDEIAHAIEQGAEGIGLYRTEFMFLERAESPDEAFHFDHYRQAIEALGGLPLVVRTLDLGADKVPVDGLPPEANPFLGTRAIRLCLERLDLFRAQLRAILRASDVGQVSVMIPFVTSIGEVRRVRGLIDDLREELAREGIAVGRAFPLGVMVETPAAVEIADLLAKHVDFFSIGTNDLIACTIAVDRSNEHVAALYQPHHPAILRMIKRVIEVGDAAGRPVSLCGEMAGDLRYTLLLVGLGLRKFSVVPPMIPEIKKLVRSVSLEEARRLADRVMAMEDPDEMERLLHEETAKILPDVV